MSLQESRVCDDEFLRLLIPIPIISIFFLGLSFLYVFPVSSFCHFASSPGRKDTHLLPLRSRLHSPGGWERCRGLTSTSRTLTPPTAMIAVFDQSQQLSLAGCRRDIRGRWGVSISKFVKVAASVWAGCSLNLIRSSLALCYKSSTKHWPQLFWLPLCYLYGEIEISYVLFFMV